MVSADFAGEPGANLIRELHLVLEWALTEKAPLRQQEIESIRRAISQAQATLHSPPPEGGVSAAQPPDGFVVAQYARTNGHQETIDRVTKRDGSVSWAVRSLSCCLSRNGTWEPELSPSARDDAFLQRCRFASPGEAFEALKAATHQKAPG